MKRDPKLTKARIKNRPWARKSATKAAVDCLSEKPKQLEMLIGDRRTLHRLVSFLCIAGFGFALSCSQSTTLSQGITVSSTNLDFGSVSLSQSKASTVTVSSSGTASVTINAISVSGVSFTAAQNTLPKTLAPGESLAVTVVFAPTSAGHATGTLSIDSNAFGLATSSVKLTGTCVETTPQLSLNTETLAFGSIDDGSSELMSLVLTSSGTAPLTVSSLSVSGSGFSIPSNPVPITLPVGQSLTLQVQFAPQTAIAATGVLTIGSDSGGGTSSTVTLSGSGTAAPNPALALSATTLSFGSVSVGSSATQTLTLTSVGDSALTISGASTAPAEYKIINASFPIVLNSEMAKALTVEFSPTTAGTSTGQMIISTNSTSATAATVGLSGFGETPSQHSVVLTWLPPTSSGTTISGYHIYRAKSGSATYTLLNASIDSLTTYTDPTVLSGNSYSYEVRSVSSAGAESLPSNQFSAAIP